MRQRGCPQRQHKHPLQRIWIGRLSSNLVEECCKKTIPELKSALLEILRKTKDREIPTHPPSNIPRRKYTSVLGTMTNFQKKRDEQKEEQISEHDQNCRRMWHKREDSGK